MTGRKALLIFSAFLFLSCGLMLCAAEDVYYYFPLNDLEPVEGTFPDYSGPGNKGMSSNWERIRMMSDFLHPYAVGNGDEEIYIFRPKDLGASAGRHYILSTLKNLLSETYIAIRRKSKKRPSGLLFVPTTDLMSMKRLVFKAGSPAPDQQKARRQFLEAKQYHYQRLLDMNIPGSAWFRYRAAEARKALEAVAGKKELATVSEPPVSRNPRTGETEMQQTLAIFSGGRALSENLQLDRRFRTLAGEARTIPLGGIQGITTAEMDWKKEIKGLNPKIDLPARYIPSDQHAVFFPTYAAMRQLIDEIDARGTPILQLLEPRSEDARTRDRYEKQLCLPSTELSRILGPHLIESLAVTGSDPFLRTGTDVAVLFEVKGKRTSLLTGALNLRQKVALSAPGARRVKGTAGSIAYSGVITPDRSVCSYMAVLAPGVVTVTNSLVQLKRLAQTAAGKQANLAAMPEYIFFRDRYKKSDKRENALVVLSDATIRRWCGPRWRIADSRRTRAAAVMADIQARHLKKRAKGKIKNNRAVSTGFKDLGKVTVTPKGVMSSVYGAVGFLTPICELKMDKVSKSESEAYAWYRKNYQEEWQKYFDPIAIRFSLSGGRLGMDITVRPLIAHSDYREVMQVTSGSDLTPTSGDPHPESMIQYTLALNPDSPTVREMGNFVGRMAPRIGANGLNWIGRWFSIYLDRDPFWDELAKVHASGGDKALFKFMEKNFNRFPFALSVEVSDALKVTIFLSALRAFIEQTAPGMTSWETIKYKGLYYVKISASVRGPDQAPFSIYYAPTPGVFVLTLNESLIKRFLERSANRSGGGGGVFKGMSLLGKSMALQARAPLLKAMRLLYGSTMRAVYQRQAWGNIIILNEWRRVLGQGDPLGFHLDFWGSRLLCPGGGEYRWNGEFRTMESTLFGHPAEPREGELLRDPLHSIESLNLGLTFEENGLRARGELTRKVRKK